MLKKQKMHVKIGDTVRIISGFFKNETGEVIKINRNAKTLIVKGINFKFKHVKPNTENEIGEIKKLYEFYLYNNQMTSLPAEIGKLKKLEYLYLENK